MKLFVLILSTDHSGGPTVHRTKRGALNALNEMMDWPIAEDAGVSDEVYQADLNGYFDDHRESLWDYWEIHETELED